MSDPSNLDLTIPLADFLADFVSDGTWANVLTDLKADALGEEAAASDIAAAAGQLWSNQMDNMFLEMYRIHQGNTLFSTSTVDATPVTVGTIDTLTADRDAAFVRVTVTARAPGSDAFVLEQSLGATFYRAGGTISQLNPINPVSRVGLTTAISEFLITGNVIAVQVTGEAATGLNWAVTVDKSRRLA